MIPNSIGKNGLLLAAFAVFMAIVLAYTHKITKAPIEKAERIAAEKALLAIVPAERFDNDLLLDTIIIPEGAENLLGKVAGESIFVAKKQNQVVAVIIPAIAPDGYSGDIKLLAGINNNGSIAGVRVISHKETAGLGDKIDLKKDDWILSFNSRSLQKPKSGGWAVKKDGGEFDQFTGATITPRAVVNQVHKILQYTEQNYPALFREK